MAERFISPGVFTRENDLSFLPQGIAEIGAAFVGPTLKGPAFRPVIVESQEDFEAWFGSTSTDFYTPYAVRNYLKESSTATIVRVLGLDGYTASLASGVRLYMSASGAGTRTFAYLHPSRTGVSIESASIGGAGLSTEFSLTISGANGTNTFTSLSINTDDTNYIGNVLGTSVTTGKDAYVYVSFPDAVDAYTDGSASVFAEIGTAANDALTLEGTVYGTYRNASTPMIRSQLVGGTRHDLFRFYTLGDGDASNQDVKISVASIRPNPDGVGYGTFSILVRALGDTDSKTSVLEQFENLTLDPASNNYIAKRIGTARTVIDSSGDSYLEGEWPNKSKYVYLDLDAGLEDVPPTALPYGFAAPATPVALADVPQPQYVTTRYSTPSGGTTAVASNKTYYGFDFTDQTSLSYLRPLPSGSINASAATVIVGLNSASVSDDGFDLLVDLTDSGSATDLSDVQELTSDGVTARKFTVPLQGGFDGLNPAAVRNTGASITADNTMGFDLSDAGAGGAIAYKQAIDALDNPDEYDINMLITPGVVYSLHPYVAQLGIDLVEGRGDAFYIMDPDILGASVSTVTTVVENLDTNYVATYHPWVKIFDEASNKNVWVPPSVVMATVYAFNDRVAAEWTAPAGLNRGGIKAVQVRSRLNTENKETLYEGRVNPIVQFPREGIVAWGQKTLQQDASALDRVNVRRLLIAVKKFIASSSRYLVFEQNVESTRQRFLSIVNPYLASVQERNGLYAFRVKMDETNNTPDIIDRNILVGEIWLQPTRVAEFISLTFNILPTGATFPE